ncbi:MAG: TonB-dependent receptor [Prevotellaceae bacterium]|nr:TonB-dependent receptor [Prevotellaceae bacterium]
MGSAKAARRAKRLLLLLALCTAVPWSLNAQGLNISGTVTGSDGTPVVGASVVVKGATMGVVTGTGGSYNITAPAEATLVFSFLGLSTVEEAIAGRDRIDVTLTESDHSLDEVVVVGYGTVKKANLTGAVDQVSGTLLADRPITSTVQALQGVVGNLNISSSTSYGADGGGAPGARMSINVRGVTGLTGNSGSSNASPLFVVDGIQSQDINAISPDDIASISVLKDAASAAIYGSNAPYGVVLITTKRGQKGAKPKVTYNANFGFSSPINLPTMLNSVEWVEMVNEIQQNTNGTNFIPDEAVERIRDFFEGRRTETTRPTNSGQEWASYDNDFGNDNNDWFKLFYKDRSFLQQHNVGLSGGAEKVTYYIGAGYNYKDGLYNYGNDSYNRYNIRGNLTSNVNKWLTTNFRAAFTKELTDSPAIDHAGSGGVMHDIARTWPIIPLLNPDGHYSRQNYVTIMEEGGRITKDYNTSVITGEMVINPVKGWNTTVNYTYTSYNNVYGRNELATVAYRPNGESYGGQRTTDNLIRQNSDHEQHTLNAFTSYEIQLGKHYLQGMVGYAQELYTHRVVDASNKGLLYSSNVPTLGVMYNNTPSVDEQRAAFGTQGVFGRITYNYEEKYLLELNGRYDGSSRFLKDVRAHFYPGVSAAWVVSKERFAEALNPYVDLLKVRASYGSLGDISFLNSDNFDYPLYYYPFYPSLGTTAATGSNWLFNGTRLPYISSPAIINDQLTWVTSTTFDVGLDVTLLKNRLTATFDWFRRTSNDIIGPAEQYPAVLGTAAPKANNASLETNGFELTLGWRDQVKDFSYGVRATLSDSKSVVKKFPNETKAINTWYDGATVGDIWGFETEGYYTKAEEDAGINQDRQKEINGSTWTAGDIKYKDLDGDGKITRGESTVDKPGDRKIIGNNAPRYLFGISLDAAWKGFDVSMFFQGIGKRDAWMSSNYFWGNTGSKWQISAFNVHKDMWSESNPNGYFPKQYFDEGINVKNQQAQTKYLQDASYLRFKNLQIGYTLPKSVLGKVGIDRLRVYVSGENLATFTSLLETVDPEFAVSTGKIYPLQSTWSVGINLSF